MGAGTLGLPSGLPSDSILDLTPQFESGEADLTGKAVPIGGANPLVRWINREITRAEPHVMAWREQARDCYRFRDGHQLSDEDLQILKAQKRPNTAINEIQKFIRFASGIERRTPQALIYAARVQDDAQAALKGELTTRFYEWWMDSSAGNYERSIAFEDKLICGIGVVDTWITRRTNPQGDPRYAHIDPLQLFWPETAKQNFEDTRWLSRESDIDVDEALHKWPDASMFLRAASGGAAQFPDFGRGAKRPINYVVPWIMTEPLNKGGGGPSNSKPGTVPILEFQYYDDEPGYYFFDPLEKDDTWLNQSDFRKYRTRLQRLFKTDISDYDPQDHRVYKRAFLLQRRILLDEPKKLPTQRAGFTWNVMTGTWDRSDKVWYGILRVLMDPQRYANAFFRQTLEIMGASTKGGYLAESGAMNLAQRRDIEANGSRPGSVDIVQPGAISGHKIQPKPIPQMPQGSMEVLSFCLGVMEKLSGLSQSLLGTDQANTPGVALRRRLTSGLVLLAAEFDSLSRFRKREGQIVFDFMKLIADNRIVRIGGAFDGQAIRLTKDPFAIEYDIVLDENDQDPNQRQMYTDSILQIAPILIRTGNFFPELFDYVNLPAQIRQRLKQGMQQSEQQKMQMAQQGISAGGRGKPRGIQDVQADNTLKQARAAENMAKAKHLAATTRRDDLRTVMDTMIDFHRARHDMQHKNKQLDLAALEKMFAAMRPSQGLNPY